MLLTLPELMETACPHYPGRTGADGSVFAPQCIGTACSALRTLNLWVDRRGQVHDGPPPRPAENARSPAERDELDRHQVAYCGMAGRPGELMRLEEVPEQRTIVREGRRRLVGEGVVIKRAEEARPAVGPRE